MKFPHLSFAMALAVVSETAHGDADPTALAAESLGRLAKAEAMSVDIAMVYRGVGPGRRSVVFAPRR